MVVYRSYMGRVMALVVLLTLTGGVGSFLREGWIFFDSGGVRVSKSNLLQWTA